MIKKWMLAGVLCLSLPAFAQAAEVTPVAVIKPGIAAVATEAFIPAQTVMQTYGVDLFYHYNSQMFLLMKGSNSVYFQVNQTLIYVNGQQVNTGVASKYENNALVIPSRYLTEGLKISLNQQGEASIQQQIKQSAAALFHTWQLYIPSVSWETHDANKDQGTLHMGAGATSGKLTINNDGTYVWNSTLDGKTITGKWEYTASLEEPIMLLGGEGADDYRAGIYKGELFLNAKGTGWLYYISGKQKK